MDFQIGIGIKVDDLNVKITDTIKDFLLEYTGEHFSDDIRIIHYIANTHEERFKTLVGNCFDRGRADVLEFLESQRYFKIAIWFQSTLAAERGNLKLLKFLKKHLSNEDLERTLRIGISFGYLDIVEWLIENNVRTKRTLYYVVEKAKEKGCKEIVELIRMHYPTDCFKPRFLCVSDLQF